MATLILKITGLTILLFGGLIGISRGIGLTLPSQQVSLVSVDYEVMTFDLSTGTSANLTKSQARDFNAEWSPDGKQITFNSDRSGSYQIFIMDYNGKNVRQLTDGNEVSWHSRWSPDGKHIVYSVEQGINSGNFNLFMMDMESGLTRQLTSHEKTDQSPIWSPDGQYIAFISNRQWSDKHPNIHTMNELYLLNLETGQEELLFETYGYIEYMNWSPDSATIMVSNVRNLYMISVKTGEIKTIDESVRSPDWSPDGQQIIFLYGGEVCTSKPDGSDKHCLSGSSGSEVVWNGSIIVFTGAELPPPPPVSTSPPGRRSIQVYAVGIPSIYLYVNEGQHQRRYKLEGNELPYHLRWRP